MVPGTTDAVLSPDIPSLNNPGPGLPIYSSPVFHQRKVAVQAWILATATLYSYFATAIGDRLKLNGRPVPLSLGMGITKQERDLWRIAAQEPHDVGIPYKAQETLRPYERMLMRATVIQSNRTIARHCLRCIYVCMYQ